MMRGYNVNTRKKRHIHGKGWLLLFVMVFVLSHGQQIQAEEYGTESQSVTEQTAGNVILPANADGDVRHRASVRVNQNLHHTPPLAIL